MESNSSAIIQNNTHTENNVSFPVYYLSDGNTIHLNHVAFTRNKLMRNLLVMESNSSAIIQNNTLTENNVSFPVCYLNDGNTIHLNHVAFTRNKFLGNLLVMESNSSAIIQNNTHTENNVENNFSFPVYYLYDRNTIHLNHVTLTRNKLRESLLAMKSNSSAIIQTNTLTENNVSFPVYYLNDGNTIHLNHSVFIRNRVEIDLLHMISNCVAKLINNTIVGNNIFKTMVSGRASYLGLDTILVESNTFSRLIFLSNCRTSLDSIQIRENKVRNDIIYVANTSGKMTNSHIENSGNLMTSAVSITCTNLCSKDFSFEITNFKIKWSYQLLHSVRPVIQLHEKVILLNVKLLLLQLPK